MRDITNPALRTAEYRAECVEVGPRLNAIRFTYAGNPRIEWVVGKASVGQTGVAKYQQTPQGWDWKFEVDQ